MTMHDRFALMRLLRFTQAAPLTLLLACGGGVGSIDPGPATRISVSGNVDPEVVALIDQQAGLVDSAPENAERRVDLALAFEANALWDEAEQAWDIALMFDPDQPVWLLHKGIALTNRGAIDEAVATYKRAIELDPTLGAAWHRLGLLQLERGEDELALASFTEVVRGNPRMPSPLVGQAEALNNLEREAEAAKACEQALALDPTYKRGHYVLGIAYRGLGRMDEALRELALGADSEVRFVGDALSAKLARYRRGFGTRIEDALDFVNAGMPAKAVPLLEKALMSQPTHRVALVNLGVAYIKLGRNEDAIEILKRASALDDKDFAVLINLATAEMGLRRFPDALKHSEEAVRAAPQVSATYYMRSHAYLAFGRVGEAFADLRKAASINIEDPRYPIEAAECALRMGRTEEAVELYAAGLNLDPNHLPALVSMGTAAEQLGRRSVAEDAYRRAKALSPKNEKVIAFGKQLGLE